MKIGIISDTHSKYNFAKTALELLLDNGAEFIIHAGDIVEYETLELLKNSNKRYIAVYGNNDAHLKQYHNEYNLVQEPYYFKLANKKFKLMHLPFYMTPDSDVVIFGHTHQFATEYKNNTLFLNPGEVCARNKPVSECAMLHVAEDRFHVTYYSKHVDEASFTQKYFQYDRID